MTTTRIGSVVDKRTSSPTISSSRGKEDYAQRKDKHKYTSNKYKSSRRTFDKEVLKKQYRKTTKSQERAFLASLGDFEVDFVESKCKTEDKLNGLCILANTS